MSAGEGRGAVLFVESNTSGTGYIFATAARAVGYRPVLGGGGPRPGRRGRRGAGGGRGGRRPSDADRA